MLYCISQSAVSVLISNSLLNCHPLRMTSFTEDGVIAATEGNPLLQALYSVGSYSCGYGGMPKLRGLLPFLSGKRIARLYWFVELTVATPLQHFSVGNSENTDCIFLFDTLLRQQYSCVLVFRVFDRYGGTNPVHRTKPELFMEWRTTQSAGSAKSRSSESCEKQRSCTEACPAKTWRNSSVYTTHTQNLTQRCARHAEYV